MWTRSIIAIVMGLVVMGGCTRSTRSIRYHVGVTTYLSHDLAFPPSTDAPRVGVIAETDPDEPLLEAEVERKIKTLLKERGYSIGTVAACDYILFAFFAVDSGNTATGTMPIFQPGGYSTSHISTNTGQWATATTHHPGTTTYIPYSRTRFSRFLGIDLYDSNRWRTAEEEDLGDAIVWRATVSSVGTSSDLRSVIDFLLIASFEHFGEDTGKRVQKTLKEKDERVSVLREATRGPNTSASD